jgi:hypothetical protein
MSNQIPMEKPKKIRNKINENKKTHLRGLSNSIDTSVTFAKLNGEQLEFIYIRKNNW